MFKEETKELKMSNEFRKKIEIKPDAIQPTLDGGLRKSLM